MKREKLINGQLNDIISKYNNVYDALISDKLYEGENARKAGDDAARLLLTVVDLVTSATGVGAVKVAGTTAAKALKSAIIAVKDSKKIVRLKVPKVKSLNGGMSWAEQSGILREILKNKGNFGIGKATSIEANELGKAWVGNGYRIASDGKTLVSKDGFRTYRPPTKKPKSPYATTGIQANFEEYELIKINKVWKKRPIRNGHLDITD